MKPMAPMRPMEPMKPMEPMSFKRWWPDDLGFPSSVGGQNGIRYAFFPEKRRLLIERNDKLTIYKSGDHRISGVSSQQQNGGEPSLSFTSQHGPVRLHELETEPASASGELQEEEPVSQREICSEEVRSACSSAQTVPSSPSSPKSGHSSENAGGERVVFSEEGQGAGYIKLVAKGEIDLDMLEALEEFVARRKRRLTRI